MAGQLELMQRSPVTVGRSRMEQQWPLSPASLSTLSEKTRIMSLEKVSICLVPRMVR